MSLQSVIGRVRTADADKGLKSCLEEAGVEDEFQKELTDASSRIGFKDLRQFAFAFSRDLSSQDKTIEEVCDASRHGNSLSARSALRFAVSIAHGQTSVSTTAKSSAEEAKDMDEPIDEDTHSRIKSE